jgi:kinetochore protein Spc25
MFPIKRTEVSLLLATYYFPYSNQSYQVITSSPHLPILPILVNALNETGDVYAFVRQVRDQYHELVSPSQTLWEHC